MTCLSFKAYNSNLRLAAEVALPSACKCGVFGRCWTNWSIHGSGYPLRHREGTGNLGYLQHQPSTGTGSVRYDNG